MSSKAEEDRIVDNLAAVMRGKLRTNAHKPHWRHNPNEGRLATLQRLIKLLKGEVGELEYAVTNAGASQVRSECGDIANYAAMIADLAGDDSPDAT